MANIRIMSWNIFNFAAGTSGICSRTPSLNRVLDEVHENGSAAKFDIFVIIEPVTQKGKVGDPAKGGGPAGGATILAQLRARTTGGSHWQLADPLVIYSKTKGETVLVFYRDDVLSLNGAPTLLSTEPAGKTPNWKILNARESCPYRVSFNVTGTATQFELIAQHAPSPTYGNPRNRKANSGVGAVRTHADVTGNTHVVYLGDLNLCGMQAPQLAACDLQGHTEDRQTLDDLINDGMLLVAGRQRSSLKKSAAVYDNYREHAYDNIFSKGHNLAASGTVLDLVAPLITAYQASIPGPVPANVFRGQKMFYQIRIGSKRGISDHLPITVTLTY